MRKTGIDDKMVFFVRRYSEPEIGSYFEYSVDKEVCNPHDPFKFYLKLGGVTFLPKKETPGKKISTSAERVKESKYFGSYVYYSETDKKIRCILYAKRKGLPDLKLLGNPGCLHSIIPRYDGNRKDRIITGMKVINSKRSDRRWSRYDIKTKADHKGFYEILDDQSLTDVMSDLPAWEVDHYKTGIYVGVNTSLLMVDTPRAHLHIDYTRNFVYTVFQEGAFICTNCPFTFCFYDMEEAEEYDETRLLLQMESRFVGSNHLDRLVTRNGLRNDVILFLKSAPNHTFWTLRANKLRPSRETEMMLCLPSGAQFEDVLFWDEGLTEVKRRQSLKPWTKFTTALTEPKAKLKDIDIDLDKNEAYPQ